jgi:hypothetical protein
MPSNTQKHNEEPRRRSCHPISAVIATRRRKITFSIDAEERCSCVNFATLIPVLISRRRTQASSRAQCVAGARCRSQGAPVTSLAVNTLTTFQTTRSEPNADGNECGPSNDDDDGAGAGGNGEDNLRDAGQDKKYVVAQI